MFNKYDRLILTECANYLIRSLETSPKTPHVYGKLILSNANFRMNFQKPKLEQILTQSTCRSKQKNIS